MNYSYAAFTRFFRVPTTNVTVSVDVNEVTLRILVCLDIFDRGLQEMPSLRYSLEMAAHETPPMSTIIYV